MKRFITNHVIHGILIIAFCIILMNFIFRVISVCFGGTWQLNEPGMASSGFFGAIAGIAACIWHFADDEKKQTN